MKAIVIAALACAASPALADLYKCHAGSKVIYQDEPCPNAQLIENLNGQAPSPREQFKARQRAARERALVSQQDKARVAEHSQVTVTMEIIRPAAPLPKPNRPNPYYGSRSSYTTGTTTSGPAQQR